MPKKPPPNGYYFFMKDYKAREERLGRRFPNGMKDVAELASDEWKSLSQEEKDEYNRIAKEHRNDPRPNIPKKLESKFNSVGISFAQLERERLAKEAKILQRKDFIHSLVNDMNIEELKVHNFHLIHVNYFCKTDHDEYFPAELAISEFSLLNGVQKVFHRFLHPGQIPTGYASEVKDHSDKYHRIPWDFVRGENKYDTIYRDIRDFLKGKYGKSDLPPLFTMYDNLFDNTSLSAAKATLETLWESANYIQGPSDDKFQVYPLPHFFHELKKKCLEATNSGELSFPNDVLAETELRKDTYHFSTEMACKFHQEEDVIAFCSQSYVIRWVHIMRDHCCESLGINIFQKPNHYASDTQALPRKLDALSLKDEQDDEEEEEEYDDCKSTRSGYSTATYFTDKSVDFRSVTGKSSVKSFASTNQSSSATPSFASALSNSTTRENSWASASQPKQAPALDNKNFPSLGRGRRMELGRGMANLRLKK